MKALLISISKYNIDERGILSNLASDKTSQVVKLVEEYMLLKDTN